MEEKNEEMKVKQFKTLKRPTKRKTVSIPEGRKDAKRKRLTEDQEPIVLHMQADEDPHLEQEEEEQSGVLPRPNQQPKTI